MAASQEPISERTRACPTARLTRASQRAFSYYAQLARLKQHVETHLSERLSAAQAARITGVSPSYFSTFFHDRVGQPFKGWSQDVRIEVAKRLIEATDVPITEVAAAVGFTAMRTFERAFKRRVHITPREYRKLVRPLPERSDT